MSESKTTTTYGNILTRRDELAEKILLAIIGHEGVPKSDLGIVCIAAHCYEIADAMIAESKKGATDGKK